MVVGYGGVERLYRAEKQQWLASVSQARVDGELMGRDKQLQVLPDGINQLYALQAMRVFARFVVADTAEHSSKLQLGNVGKWIRRETCWRTDESCVACAFAIRSCGRLANHVWCHSGNWDSGCRWTRWKVGGGVVIARLGRLSASGRKRCA